MDWILGASVWEFNESGQDDFPVLTESSSTTEENKNVDLFHVDRGFDGLGNDGIMNKMSKEKELVANKEAFASKRSRGYNGNNQQTSCLVDGCNADLSSCRDYHRRHRVCERHSKTPVVVIGGKEQRFCQQCSRFHSLGEFDDVKRSCRKRLDGHNRRRRKPQPESLYLNCGNFLANNQGAKLLQFGNPEAQTTAYGSNLSWGNESKYSHQTTSSNSTNHIYNGTQINFPFLLNKPNQSVPETFNVQALKSQPKKLTQLVKPKTLLNTPNLPVPETLNMQASKSQPGKLSRLVKPKSAHSLLSTTHNNTKTQIHTTRTFPSHLMMQQQQNFVHQNQRLECDGLPQYLHSQYISQDLHGGFGFGSEGFLENEASQLISFSCN